MKNILFILLYLGVVISSCKQKPENPEALNRYNEVMAIHDEVMPKMSDIHQLKKSLKKEMENEDENQKKIFMDAIVLLDNADESMMEWMANFKLPELESEQMEYLKKEKIAIQKVSDDMYKAMNHAQTILDKK